jgi:hypothetical protein
LSVTGNHRLHIFAAALGENGIDFDIPIFLVAFFLGDIDGNRYGKEHPVGHYENQLGARRGTFRGGSGQQRH